MSDTPTDPEPTPIVVNTSQVPAQIEAQFRVLLIAVGGYCVGKGWISQDIVTALVPVLLIGLPALRAWWKTKSNHDKQVTMANHLPDRIATVQS